MVICFPGVQGDNRTCVMLWMINIGTNIGLDIEFWPQYEVENLCLRSPSKTWLLSHC